MLIELLELRKRSSLYQQGFKLMMKTYIPTIMALKIRIML